MDVKDYTGTMAGQQIPSILKIYDNMLPELREWDVGGTYTVKLQLEFIGKEKGSLMEEAGKTDGVRTCGKFRVMQAGSMDEMKEKQNKLDEMAKYIEKLKAE